MASNGARSLPPLRPALQPSDRRLPPPVGDGNRPTKKLKSIACVPCHDRKIKCDGVKPTCGECVNKSFLCRYQEKTSKQDMQTQMQHLRYQLFTFQRFVDMLKNAPATNATTMLENFRAGAELEDLLNTLTEADLTIQLSVVPEIRRRYDFPYYQHMPSHLLFEANTYLDSKIYQATLRTTQSETSVQTLRSTSSHQSTNIMFPQDAYDKPFRAATLADPILENLDVSKWTTVLSDNQLLRRILGAYFLYPTALSPVLHKDIFFEDMALNGHRFASKLLVNAILASGCQHCFDLEDRSITWVPNELAYKFLSECRRLWELELLEETSLTTLQAALVMHITYNLDGKDFIAVRYLQQSIDMSQALDLFGPSRHSVTSRTYKARLITAWALYSRQIATCLVYSRPLMLTRPPQIQLPDPLLNPGFYGDVYVQYPSSEQLIPLHMDHKMYLEAELYVLLSTMASFTVMERRSLGSVFGLKKRLDAWFAKVTKLFHPKILVFPIHFHLHTQYYFWIIKLFQPLVEPTGLLSVAALLQDSPHEIIHHSYTMLETLLRLYYLRHSYETYDTWVIHFLIVLGTDTLKTLYSGSAQASQLSQEVLHSTLALVFSGLEQQGKRAQIAKMGALGLQKSLKPEELQMVGKYLSLEPVTEKEQTLIDESVRCMYPISIVSSDGRVETKQLGELVKRVERFAEETGRGHLKESSDAGSE